VEVIRVDDVFDEDPVLSWTVLSVVGNLSVVKGVDPEGLRRDELDAGLLAMFSLIEGHVDAVEVLRAQDVAHRLNVRLVEILHRAPLLLAPVTAGRTPKAEAEGTIDGVENPNWVQLTYPFNLTRSPVGSVVAGFDSDGLPVGLQIVGPQHGDAAVLRATTVLEDLLALDTVCPYEPAS
jgi:aspartyl-tRNA(Asn)/glutamyl-tRNA(Gln) amidotransferase subunit A